MGSRRGDLETSVSGSWTQPHYFTRACRSLNLKSCAPCQVANCLSTSRFVPYASPQDSTGIFICLLLCSKPATEPIR